MRTAHSANNIFAGFVLHLNMSKAGCGGDYEYLLSWLLHFKYPRTTCLSISSIYPPLFCCLKYFIIVAAIQTINYPSGRNEQLEEFCKQNPIVKELKKWIWYERRRNILMCFLYGIKYFATYRAGNIWIKKFWYVISDRIKMFLTIFSPIEWFTLLPKKIVPNPSRVIHSTHFRSFPLTSLLTFGEGDDSTQLKIDFILFVQNHVETKDIFPCTCVGFVDFSSSWKTSCRGSNARTTSEGNFCLL